MLHHGQVGVNGDLLQHSKAQLVSIRNFLVIEAIVKTVVVVVHSFGQTHPLASVNEMSAPPVPRGRRRFSNSYCPS